MEETSIVYGCLKSTVKLKSSCGDQDPSIQAIFEHISDCISLQSATMSKVERPFLQVFATNILGKTLELLDCGLLAAKIASYSIFRP